MIFFLEVYWVFICWIESLEHVWPMSGAGRSCAFNGALLNPATSYQMPQCLRKAQIDRAPYTDQNKIKFFVQINKKFWNNNILVISFEKYSTLVKKPKGGANVQAHAQHTRFYEKKNQIIIKCDTIFWACLDEFFFINIIFFKINFKK